MARSSLIKHDEQRVAAAIDAAEAEKTGKLRT